MHISLESKIQKIADRVMNCILLGFLCFITSLGIITIGASICALNVAMESYLYNEDPRPMKTYFCAFKQHFKVSTIVWIIHMAVIAILIVDLVYYWYGESSMDTIGAVAMSVLLTMIVFELIMIFICIPHYNIRSINEAFKKSFDVAFSCMLESFMLLILNIAIPIIVIFLFRGTILFFAGISAYLSWQIIPKMLEKYKYKQGNNEVRKHGLK